MKNKQINHSSNTFFKFNLNLICSVIPLILYGFYKNAFLVNKLISLNILDLLKPILLPLIAFLIPYIIYLVKSIIKKENKSILNKTLIPSYSILASLVMPPQINLGLFCILLFIITLIYILFFDNKEYINYPGLIVLIIFLLLILCENFNFLNLYELNKNIKYTGIDMFFGKNFGGIGTTNIFLCLISYLILINCKMYKKDIPIYIMGGLIITLLITSCIKNNFSEFFMTIYSHSIIYSIIFLAPFSMATPVDKKNRIIYSILIGIFTAVLLLFIPSLAIFLTIFCVSIFTKIINKI